MFISWLLTGLSTDVGHVLTASLSGTWLCLWFPGTAGLSDYSCLSYCHFPYNTTVADSIFFPSLLYQNNLCPTLFRVTPLSGILIPAIIFHLFWGCISYYLSLLMSSALRDKQALDLENVSGFSHLSVPFHWQNSPTFLATSSFNVLSIICDPFTLWFNPTCFHFSVLLAVPCSLDLGLSIFQSLPNMSPLIWSTHSLK